MPLAAMSVDVGCMGFLMAGFCGMVTNRFVRCNRRSLIFPEGAWFRRLPAINREIGPMGSPATCPERFSQFLPWPWRPWGSPRRWSATWALSFVGHRVLWRGYLFRLLPGGRIDEILP
ncbi:MAG: hypothetical protein ED859_10695 [Desulfuromonadales bacterium]|nr:MAG: hypothetical protein ED859_10695 [Desulfuromonadales bacterium]